MKRSLAVASLLFCLGNSVLVAADESRNWFVGGEFGGMRSKAEVSASGVETDTIAHTSEAYSGTISDHSNATYESLKFGKYFDFGRLYGFVSHQNKKDNIDSNTFGLGYDYLFKNKSAFTPFIGATLGYTKADVKMYDEDGADFAKELGFDSPKGLTYGLNIGAFYSLNKSLDLEIGARYLKHNIDKTFSESDSGTGWTDTFSGKFEIKDSIQYYLGLNYNF